MHAPRALRPLLAALLIAGSALGVAACGSSDTASTVRRAASSDPVCPEQTSETRQITFVNDLTTYINLDVPRASWNCDQYSGYSTPATIDGRSVAPSGQEEVRLETVKELSDKKRKGVFGLRIRAGATTLANLTVGGFRLYGGKYILGIEVKRRLTCGKGIAVEVRDAAGAPAWVWSPNCEAGEPWVLQISGTKPT